MIKRRTADQKRVRQPEVLAFTILMGLHIGSSFRVSPAVSDLSCFRAHIHCCGDRFCPPRKNPTFTPSFCIDMDKPAQAPPERASNILLSTARNPDLTTFVRSFFHFQLVAVNLRLPAGRKAREPYVKWRISSSGRDPVIYATKGIPNLGAKGQRAPILRMRLARTTREYQYAEAHMLAGDSLKEAIVRIGSLKTPI